MSSYAELIQPHVEAELLAAADAEANGNPAQAFRHLERAHVLGQPSTYEHVRIHWRMLLWGWRQGSAREYLGQVPRIIAAATKTVFGLVPTGNTGGSNVSPIKPMPVPADLEVPIQGAKAGSRSRSTH